MLLLQSIALGAKTCQRLTNSDRDTHLYSFFFTCRNLPFGYLLNSFILNCIKFIQFILHLLKIAVFRCCYSILGIREQKWPNTDEFRQRYTFVQLFLELHKYVFRMYFKFFHSKLHKSPSIYIHPLNISSFRRSYCSLVMWEVKMVKD